MTIYLRTADLERMKQSKVASLFNVSSVAIIKWVKEMGCPQNPDRTYNLGDVITWRIRYYEDKIREILKSANRSKEMRLFRSEVAKIKQIQRRKLEGDLIDLDSEMKVIALFCSQMRKAGETLGRLYGKGAQQIMIEALETFRKYVSDIKKRKATKKSSL